MPQEDEETNPTIVVSSDERQTEGPGGRAHKRRRTPLSLPRKKRKEICHIHTPQSHLPTPHLKTMTGKLKVSPDWSLQMKTRTP